MGRMRSSGLSCRLFGRSESGEDGGTRGKPGSTKYVTSHFLPLVHPQTLIGSGGTTDLTEKRNRGLVLPAGEAAPTWYCSPSCYAVQPPAPPLQGQLPHLPPQQPAAL